MLLQNIHLCLSKIAKRLVLCDCIFGPHRSTTYADAVYCRDRPKVIFKLRPKPKGGRKYANGFRPKPKLSRKLGDFFRLKAKTEAKRSHVAVMNDKVVHSVICCSQNPPDMADRPAIAFSH